MTSKDKINSRLNPKSRELRTCWAMDTQNLVLSDSEIIFNAVVNRHGRIPERLLGTIPEEEAGGNDGRGIFEEIRAENFPNLGQNWIYKSIKLREYLIISMQKDLLQNTLY